jgi:hypothetical protein
MKFRITAGGEGQTPNDEAGRITCARCNRFSKSSLSSLKNRKKFELNWLLFAFSCDSAMFLLDSDAKSSKIDAPTQGNRSGVFELPPQGDSRKPHFEYNYSRSTSARCSKVPPMPSGAIPHHVGQLPALRVSASACSAPGGDARCRPFKPLVSERQRRGSLFTGPASPHGLDAASRQDDA